MSAQYSLFSQVALAEDLPEYALTRGTIATVVEHYAPPENKEDGYSLEGFDIEQVTVEIAESQIISVKRWQQEETKPLEIQPTQKP
ncbi:MAG: DUF4926 domain-containing protein [Phormidesmis sp.]